jgi:hypothetical protein
MPAPLLSTMDHCPLPASRGMLRFKAPLKNAHFASRAGAVMDGSGLEASFGAGCPDRFAARTNLAWHRALSSILNRARLSQSLLDLARSFKTLLSRIVSAVSHLQDGADPSRRDPAILKPRKMRRYQVSTRKIVRRYGTVKPPTNHHLEALDPPSSQARRGLLVWRRERRQCASRARPSPSPRTLRFEAGARGTRRGAGVTCRAQPSQCGGQPACRELRLVLLVRLLSPQSLFPLVLARRVFDAVWVRRGPRPCGRSSSDRIDNEAKDDGSGKGICGFHKAVWGWRMRRSQSGTRVRDMPEQGSGEIEHGQPDSM